MKDIKYRIGCALHAYLTCLPFDGGKRVIVSEYKNSYEWINTYYTLSVWLLKLSYRLKGQYDTNFEMYDSNKDQVTYHTPYHNIF